MNATKKRRALLILDLDETLVHSLEEPLPGREPDLVVDGKIFVYKRPHVDAFLARVEKHFRIAIWSAGTADYVEPTIAFLFKKRRAPVFVWSRRRCTPRRKWDYDLGRVEEYYLKDLSKVKKLGHDLARVLIVGDSPRAVARHYGNAVYVKAYEGSPQDDELLHLLAYLPTLAACENMRKVEKRGWRHKLVKEE